MEQSREQLAQVLKTQIKPIRAYSRYSQSSTIYTNFDASLQKPKTKKNPEPGFLLDIYYKSASRPFSLRQSLAPGAS
jgi:hypothetical protein